jgi:WD40 repeat protein
MRDNSAEADRFEALKRAEKNAADAKLAATEAKLQAENAESSRLNWRAINQIRNQRADTAALLALRAVQIKDVLDTRGALFSVLQAKPGLIGVIPMYDGVTSVAVRSMGRDIKVYAAISGNVHEWDLATRKHSALRGNGPSDMRIALSPNQSRLAAYSDRKTAFWDLTRDEEPLFGDTVFVGWRAAGDHAMERAVPMPDQSDQQSVASPDGKWLVTASRNSPLNFVRLDQRQSGTSVVPSATDAIRLAPPASDAPTMLAFSRDSQNLIAASGRDIFVCPMTQVGTGRTRIECYALAGHDRQLTAIAAGADGAVLAAEASGSVHIWSTARSPATHRILDHGQAVRALAVSADGHIVVSTSLGGEALVWALREDATRITISKQEKSPRLLVFSPTSGAVAASSPPQLEIWNGAAQPKILVSERAYSTRPAFSRDGKLFAAPVGTIRLWNTRDWSELPSLPGVNGATMIAAAFSPDGKWIAGGSDESQTRIGVSRFAIWNLAARDQPVVHTLKNFGLIDVGFTPDGKTALAIGRDVIHLWDVAGKRWLDKQLGVGETETAEPVAVFSPDGATLIITCGTGLCLWNTSTWEPLAAPASPPHPGSVAVSRDGSMLASATLHEVRLWDFATRELIGAFPVGGPGVYDTQVKQVAFKPEGNSLYVLTSRALELWDIGSKAWASRACQVAGRNFTQAEWSRFFGKQEPYRRVCPQWPPGDR